MAPGIELFGSTAELISFAEIFFGSLVVSLLYFFIKKKMSSLPLPG
jgi:VIT1/CCC1 family predicted Fe2+/Mn2+ transporter